MRFDLKRPCKHCPFSREKTAIRFASRERAEEIEESAYRYGFPCHESAELREDDEEESDGYHEGPKSQHCIGFVLMQLNEGGNSPWPGIGNDQDLIDRLDNRLDLSVRRTVFEGTEEFFEANDENR